MANGLQIAASGLIAQERRLDAVANDIANANTVGYQASRSAFTELLGGTGGVRVSTAGTVSAEGIQVASDNPFSVALDGPGFVQVRTDGGVTALTRDGNLRLDSSRNLVASSGARVHPPVTVPADVTADQVSIAPDGAVTAADRRLGTLTLVEVPAPDGLAGSADGLMTTTAASGAAAPAKATTVAEGVLEQSNVDLATALTEMMEAQRAFQLASRALHTQDQMLEIANGIRR
jgi:flagellar basal-body rod protein FlgG